MDGISTIDDRISVLTFPPNAADIEKLAEAGFKSVINLRNVGENGEVLSPDAEAGEVQQRGMQYLHYPMAPSDLTSDCAQELTKKLEELPGPVAIHCASGRRAGLMGLSTWANANAQDAATAAEQGRDAGLQLGEADLAPLINDA